MVKKIFCSTLCVLFALSLLATAACAADETPADTSQSVSTASSAYAAAAKTAAQSDVHSDAIAYCASAGFFDVVDNESFDPSAAVSRRSMLRVMHAAFTDHDAADPSFLGCLIWAAKNGILQDFGAGVLSSAPATREDTIRMLWRGAGSPDSSSEVPAAVVADVTDGALDAVRWALTAKLFDDLNADTGLRPQDTVTGAETASLLYTYLMHSAEQTAATPKTLIAYFSATGTTRATAETIASLLGADLLAITPSQPYTADDLAYGLDSRAGREQSDPAARPGIEDLKVDMTAYDTIFVGYPIWHGQAPRVISTFLESIDLAGKTVVPFCTSHSSPLGDSDTNLHNLAPDANWLPGARFAADTDAAALRSWLDELHMSVGQDTENSGFDLSSGTVMLNSGYEMPTNGLGTYSLHGDTAVRSVKAALASGVRLIDTARAYGNEEEIGLAIREAMEEYGIPREDIFVTTKIYPGSDMADPEAAIQGCLDRLDIGYIDLMLLHHPDPNDVQAYKAMERFAAEGKIRSLGLSNWYVDELEEFLPQVDVPPAVVQNEIHPYYQENDVIPYIQNHGIVVEGWYPFGGRGHTKELLENDVIMDIAAAHNVSAAQVILRWNLQKGVVVIPGSSNPDHIRENADVYGFTLTDEEMDRINALDRGEKHDWY